MSELKPRRCRECGEGVIRPLAKDVIGDVGRVLWILLGTVGIVLLIACANVANLFLVRAEGRQQELAIHAALGAGSRRIAWELLSESLVLGLIGGVASGAAMLPYTVIKEANPPTMSGTATGVVNFLNFTFSALLGPVFAWLLVTVSGGASTMTLDHYQMAFQPLLY